MNLKYMDYFEWQTFLLILLCYTLWFSLILAGGLIPTPIWIIALALATTLFLSILHETVHGHPTPDAMLNRMLVALPIGWLFPYERFRDTHLQHHDTGELTDPLDDPESWYVYAREWETLGPVLKVILTFNNTLAGRMLIGPAITLIRFLQAEISIFAKTREIRSYLLGAWSLHIFLCALLIVFIANFGSQPLWAYVAGAYLGFSVLLIRTFLEHQSAENFLERTVVIEKCCPVAFLFLFNNLHALHHEKPGIPWYRLPGEFRKHRERLLASNNYYVYRSYGDVFAKYFLRPKEPVIYPPDVTQPDPARLAQETV
ncbi:MAG: fatty acid desaturase [Pseudomonadota bacterium]